MGVLEFSFILMFWKKKFLLKSHEISFWILALFTLEAVEANWCYFFENWFKKLKCPHLLKPLGTIFQHNYWSFYTSELFTLARFNMRHPVHWPQVDTKVSYQYFLLIFSCYVSKTWFQRSLRLFCEAIFTLYVLQHPICKVHKLPRKLYQAEAKMSYQYFFFMLWKAKISFGEILGHFC